MPTLQTPAALLLTACVLAIGPPAQAQLEGSDEPKNLQYFPKEIKRSELMPRMRQFSFALGVPCTYCHGTAAQTGFDLGGVDFSTDLKPAKANARDMLRMVDTINSSLLPKVSHRSALHLEVSCFTCHSGMPRPEAIEARVQARIKSGGVETAVADYRALRAKYFGSAAYNFKEQPLVEVAVELHEQGNDEASIAISLLNLEFHPQSEQSRYWLAEAYAGSGAEPKARAIYEELLKARPEDRRLKEKLEALAKAKKQ